ncbi:glycoprotease [Podospora didyma]|uniref:Glycoprotease n=1 Tax=Podospora didyma TaxID=330526 RepID=A0AAE0P6Y1_9PEZI|nr:glycoprotease [Podospora didyma]
MRLTTSFSSSALLRHGASRRTTALPLHRHHHGFIQQQQQRRRSLLTLAIETSCDDTCVAILEKCASGAARLHFDKKFTSDNRADGGVNPKVAVGVHTQKLSSLVQEAMQALPLWTDTTGGGKEPPLPVRGPRTGEYRLRSRPDFISVTRGPGMTSNLAVGINTAKGLAVAWEIPVLGVHHMQAHALTPMLVDALAAGAADPSSPRPKEKTFPFLTLLVSGGHTQLVLSHSLTSHSILATAPSTAIGNMLDQAARIILPPSVTSSAANVMYGALLEQFAFPPSSTTTPTIKYNYTPPINRAADLTPFSVPEYPDWHITPPHAQERTLAYSFTGIGSQVQTALARNPDMSIPERQMLARGCMQVAFEHLISVALLSLTKPPKKKPSLVTPTTKDILDRQVKMLVISGGVASNGFLRHIVRSTLDARGFKGIEVVAPPVRLCTDNAAMIAWAGMEMWEAGWRTGLGFEPRRKWSVDEETTGGGDDKGGLLGGYFQEGTQMLERKGEKVDEVREEYREKLREVDSRVFV